MTTREADKIIKKGEPVTVHNAFYNETFSARFVRRDRYRLYSDDGGIYERNELEIVPARRPEYTIHYKHDEHG